ncbi:hypothetical protein SH1V18_46400 [Vallitalea longa]|uniref:Radical SAM core domain-containing protein n=1 Tax=Vallitalea longa TaxID=2936439 RepID=A0A9W6DH01_9FIRM|nr:radical SAM protein [Vallitalea longa]GKX32160.1 hypothetical protein SH1V18_46400 [Vallitalea longa]
MLDYSKNYYLDKDFELNVRDDKYLLIDFDNVNWFRTNKTGLEILNGCKKPNNFQTVLEHIAKDYGFTVDFLKEQFESFIEFAIDKQVIIEEGKEKQKFITKELQYPNTIWIHVSNQCNLSCPFCYSNATPEGIKTLNPDDILKFLEPSPKEQRKRAIISGGEPFLYKKLPELVKGLKEMGFKVTVISNGTVGSKMYPEVLPYIDLLQVSVDGTTKEINDLTRGKGSFDKTIENIKYAKSLDVKDMYISFTATKYNIEDIMNFPEFMYIHDIGHLHVTRLLPVGRGETNKEDISPDNDKYTKYIKEFKDNIQYVNQKIYQKRETEEIFLDDEDKTKFRSVTFASDQLKKVKNRNKVTGCGAGDATISIGYDGNVYPCTSLSDTDNIIGNIYTDKIDTVIKRGQEVAKHLSVHNLPECNQCKYKYFCGGGCRACAKYADNILGHDPDCNYYKKSIMEYMWLYHSS